MKKNTPIAIVGMAGLFPGASDLSVFWDNIVNRVEAISEVPEDRWAMSPETAVSPDGRPDTAFSRRAGLLPDPLPVPDGLSLDPDLVRELDPLYRIVLHVGRNALDATLSARLDRDRVGTILAAIALPTETSSKLTRNIMGTVLEEKIFGKNRLSGNFPEGGLSQSARVTGLPAALLARALELGGGSYTLDAACASSLYAVKLACDELRLGHADAMLAGGVSRPDCLYTQIGFTQLRALSPGGRCAPFDGRADGLVVGEGAGIVVLKRLEDAVAGGDPIHGVIRGFGLSNDMRGNLLAPDSEGQVRAMTAAYAEAGWSPEDVDLIECHGAGTPLGDRTELISLMQLWKDVNKGTGPCPIGSIKSMIGHLLTAAGAAGLIKTLLALGHRTLPPSLNFKSPADGSPLVDGPFTVQTEPAPWERRDPLTPRRAAVSAFGFGGINAHLLVEEWSGAAGTGTGPRKGETCPARSAVVSPDPIAIVGMDAVFGAAGDLREFQETVLDGGSAMVDRPSGRWNGCEPIAGRLIGSPPSRGGFLDRIDLAVGEFHLPPSEIPDILPQHLLILRVAARAMADAGLAERRDRPGTGVVIGMEFDMEATDFHFRWSLPELVRRWAAEHGTGLDRSEIETRIEALKGSTIPPLTATRTLGALGGVIASRIAREFRFGGPSFAVSDEAASGLRALQVAFRSLAMDETDAMLVGAIDLAGDLRAVALADGLCPFSAAGTIRPFDKGADGTLPADGAAALVLKRLDRAERDGDRIYAVIRGIEGATGNGSPGRAYGRSLEHLFRGTGIDPDTIGYLETGGTGDPPADLAEAEGIAGFFPVRKGDRTPCAVGSVTPNIGRAGAAAGMASLVKTALSLYQEILPPLRNFVESDFGWNPATFHIPARPQYWVRNRADGPRRACVASTTLDGNCCHVLLEEAPAPDEVHAPRGLADRIRRERTRPLGSPPFALFTVTGADRDRLREGLDRLEREIRRAQDAGTGPDTAARNWFRDTRMDGNRVAAVSIAGYSHTEILSFIAEARDAIAAGRAIDFRGRGGGAAYRPDPIGNAGTLAFVYPGSGNHYVGMGRGVSVRWPEVLREMDAASPRLKTEMCPEAYVPHRLSWKEGWENEAYRQIAADPLTMIFGQVFCGSLMTGLVERFGIRAGAVIGYSLGESAGLFATRAWPRREEMRARMLSTDLFTNRLAGRCDAVREAWRIPDGKRIDWRAAVVNRPAPRVKEAILERTGVRLLIVNTPEECVIGGLKDAVAAAVDSLGCEAVYLDGVVTVHCDALEPVREAYRSLHLFPTTPPEGVRYYSCAAALAYDVTPDSAADSIVNNARHGFDFPLTIRRAYKDGVRSFLEMGPQASCTRMIRRILGDSPHLALSASARGETEEETFIRFLGTLIAEGVGVDLAPLYGDAAFPPQRPISAPIDAPRISVPVGGIDLSPPSLTPVPESRPAGSESGFSREPAAATGPVDPVTLLEESFSATAKAHQSFLEFTEAVGRAYETTVEVQSRLIEAAASGGAMAKVPPPPGRGALEGRPEPAFDRDMCLEFAVGSAARVLGPEFAPVDTFRARVRLPDEPLMLVDRILSVTGKKGSMTSGRIVTEHDVVPGAWYLDGEKVPVCISVEAGQADLFLSAYLGIDLQVRGERTYRLLDATVVFHRSLPEPGDTIRYEIEIEKFVRQGETWLFFFHFEGYIGNSHLITMTDGCAGFFTEAEVRNSGGIILSRDETAPRPGARPKDRMSLVSAAAGSLDEAALEALRAGDGEAAFGPEFSGVWIPESLRLPGGRMRLIDRILNFDPEGGRFGLGIIRAEADIRPDDWFLTCHFVDDRVMPGTLMYECCAHTLRVLLQRTGWVTDRPDAAYEPVVGTGAVLKCRGPVTPRTRKVVYEVEIRETGDLPEPYVIADALMVADGHPIVQFKGMSMRLSGVTRDALERFWSARETGIRSAPETRRAPSKSKSPVFDRDQILEFAVGNPSAAFGPRFADFDKNRFIARLPGPPYAFMDRVTRVEPEPRVMKPGGWLEAEVDIHPDAWYFRANRTPSLPFCVLLEMALQPCGFLAAYVGTALTTDKDLRFRNLGGNAVLHRDIPPVETTLTLRTRLRQVSSAADMILQDFDMEVLDKAGMIYEGTTGFGFFTREALARQVGIRKTGEAGFTPSPSDLEKGVGIDLPDLPPFFPEDRAVSPGPPMALPSRALRMIDRIDLYLPEGGPAGLGFVRGSKRVDPKEWFFKAHFFLDPVCPGSLGIESFLQLIKFAALGRWKDLAEEVRFAPVLGDAHSWIYRGQILRTNRRVEIDAVVTRVIESPVPTLMADGDLRVDGLHIYRMENFGIALVPATEI